jgi:hypothetical protein
MFSVEPVSFNINVVGTTTGTEYLGTFKVYPILSTAQQLARDAIMRDLLGPNCKDASARAQSQAFVTAEIRIRSVEVPTFWTESKAGMNLFDEEVASTIFDKIQEVEVKWREDIKKKADAARDALRAMPENK